MNRKVPSDTRRYSRVVLTLLLLIVQFRVSAQLLPQATDDFWKPYRLLEEDRSRRDAFSKHYRLADGNYTAVIGAGPIHYLKNGQYEDIDVRVETVSDAPSGYPYGNRKNILQSFFGERVSRGIVSRTEEGDVKEFLNTRMYWETGGAESGRIPSADVACTVSGDKASYRNLYPGIDAEFTVEGGRRKLNYRIADAGVLTTMPAEAEYLVFTEEIQMAPTWRYEQDARGVLLKDASGKSVYRYENPVSNDQTDMGLYTDNTWMEVSQTGHVLTVSIKVKTEWLAHPDRVFPVLVDPTTTVYPDNLNFWTGQTNSGGGGTSGSPAAGLATSTWYRSYIKFNTTSLPACTVSDAQLYLKPTNIQGTYNTTTSLGITQSKYDLSSDDFFPTYASVYNAITAAANTSGDYVAITTAGTLNAYRSFSLGTTGGNDIAAKAGGAGSFFVVSLRPGWTGGGTATRYMVFGDHTSTGNRPYLTVTYTQTEPYCHPTHVFSNCAAFNDCRYIGIARVATGTINNGTTYNNIPIGYNSYAAQSTDVLPGNSYSLSVTYRDDATTANPGKVAVWIDWDRDGTFQAGEFLGVSGNLGNTGVYTVPYTVPSGATAGTVRMRVRCAYQDEVFTAADACKTMDYGETEDYSLNIVAPANHTLTVSGAGTGANPADGNYTYSPGTSVTATAGTRSGFVLTGWTGTGSVPASGTGSSVTFTINQNSTITWNWASVTATAAPVFHNYGGSTQLAFNNSRFNIGASPVFRLSHGLNAATDYRIEIHTAADYSGASWSHRFSGTYASGTETNFTFPASAGFVPVAGTTYYVRAATSGDNGNVWSAWSQGTYSFTQEGSALPDWYQTTAPQFLTDTLIATQATASGVGLLASPGSNPIVNPNFANTSGWTVWKTFGTEALVEVSSTDCSNCPAGTTRNLKMYLWTASVLSGDMLIVSQQVDLTNVDEIRFNASSYYGPNGSNPGGAVSNLRFIIGGTASNEAGTVLHTTSQAYCPTYCTNSVNDPNIVINTSAYTGVQTIKFVVKFTQTHTTQGLLSFYVNNVQASADVPGRVIGTPVNLASVKDAVAYDRVEWTQTLNGGAVNLKLQYQNGNAWTDVPGHDNISATTDGLQTHSLTGMTPYPRVRLVGRLSGAAGVLLNNWSIKFPVVDPLPVAMERFTAHCHNGKVKLDWLTSSEQNNDRFLLQRSANLADWEDLATVAGNGNSNRPIAYTSVDERPYRHTGYYRLIQTDYDGTSATYGPVSVSCPAPEAENGIRIYPNPAADYFTLALHLQQAAPDAELLFTDPNGKICRTQRLVLAEGDSEILVEREGLAAGMYFVTVRAENLSLPPVKLLLR